MDYYLTKDKSQEVVCKIFKCSKRSLMRCLINTIKIVKLKEITRNQ